jgi:hypothetical protein
MDTSSVSASRQGADLRPRAEQRQQKIELVNAMTHRRPTALDIPASTPRDGEVFGVAVPEGVTRGHQRPADALLRRPVDGQQCPRATCTGAEPVLEDDGDVHPSALGDGEKLVDLRKAERRRLL